MLKFKEFPCTVFLLTHTYKVRKVTVHREQYRGSTSSGISNSAGAVYASECHPTFVAAIKAARNKVAKREKAHQKVLEELNKIRQSLDLQETNHLNPPKKAVHHVPSK